MILKKFKPRTSSLRHRVLLNKKMLNLTNLKILRLPLIKNSGRNSTGSITIRHQGAGVFSFFKCVDYKRLYKKPGYICDIQYDKHRTGLIGLINHGGSFSYLLLPELKNNSKVLKTTFSYRGSVDSLGDTLPIGWIPNTKIVFNVELIPGHGGLFARAAGTFCKIMRQRTNSVEIKLPSGLLRRVSPLSFASVGRVSNLNHRFEHYSYAGYFRHLGKRPSVRGEAMNAVDHPHGGKTRGGKPAMSPWGKVIK